MKTLAPKPSPLARRAAARFLTLVIFATGCSAASPTAGFQAPPDLKPTCIVSPGELQSWFVDGKITANGLVAPANSLSALTTNCDFYAWSWQMFLWCLSPSGDGRVFLRPPFFDVDGNGNLVSGSSGDSGLKRVRGPKPLNADGTGQAGVVAGVLMTQDTDVTPDGSLVYYAIHVNDVMGYMASGVNSSALTGLKQFPTTAEALAQITQYAQATYGASIPDGQALAMELKSSWVKVDPSADLSRFVTIIADVPHFVEVSDRNWTWDGRTLDRGVTLACVGFHVVGSTAGHPEMVWATFEHSATAPDANYFYTATDNTVKEQVNWQANGTPVEAGWLFMDASGKREATNQMHMEMQGRNILATPDNVISASNTSRTHPWGNTPTPDNAPNNTDIVSINQSVITQLAAGDVRANYHLIGANWTTNGVPGVGLQLPVVVGSKVLANATMETYFQFKNCFDCHQGGNLNGLSHIFGTIKPLPPPTASPASSSAPAQSSGY